MNTLILLVLAAMTAVEQAAPTPIASAQKTIAVLKVKAQHGVTSVYQDILTLQNNNVRHSSC